MRGGMPPEDHERRDTHLRTIYSGYTHLRTIYSGYTPPERLKQEEYPPERLKQEGYPPWCICRVPYPPWYTTCIYASLHTQPCTAQYCMTLTRRMSPRFYTFSQEVEAERVLREKETLSPLRHKPPSPRKRLKRDQQTRYRESVCTRPLRIPQPLQK